MFSDAGHRYTHDPGKRTQQAEPRGIRGRRPGPVSGYRLPLHDHPMPGRGWWWWWKLKIRGRPKEQGRGCHVGKGRGGKERLRGGVCVSGEKLDRETRGNAEDGGRD